MSKALHFLPPGGCTSATICGSITSSPPSTLKYRTLNDFPFAAVVPRFAFNMVNGAIARARLIAFFWRDFEGGGFSHAFAVQFRIGGSPDRSGYSQHGRLWGRSWHWPQRTVGRSDRDKQWRSQGARG